MSLFGDDEPAPQEPAAPLPAPAADWQVDLLRKSLDARGLVSMEDRRVAIESAAGRAVESLRSLTHDEALTVLSALGQTSPGTNVGGSRWDERDEDTWIDRL